MDHNIGNKNASLYSCLILFFFLITKSHQSFIINITNAHSNQSEKLQAKNQNHTQNFKRVFFLTCPFSNDDAVGSVSPSQSVHFCPY